MTKALSIETVQVEICVVRVDGHKMTIATFRQIPEVCYWQAKETHQPLGWVQAPAPWPEQSYVGKDVPPMNPQGHWILCVSPEGTLQKAPWPDLKKAPSGKQLYMAT
jgi:hypothetical protein